MRKTAINALGRMFLPGKRLFVHHLQMTNSNAIQIGTSKRYTANVLIALANEKSEISENITPKISPTDICSQLIDEIQNTSDLGEAALTLWASRAMNHKNATMALDQMKRLNPAEKHWPTVEIAWSLSALTIESSSPTDNELAAKIAHRLITSFSRNSKLFPHYPGNSAQHWLRRHISCFADLVYPIQALSLYSIAAKNTPARDAAQQCAEKMCQLQGRDGQWWWHYDYRNANIVEKYPVYAVHQDAMAPMALQILKKAGGGDYSQAIQKGMDWLASPFEMESSLIDKNHNLIWRKIARQEPGKLVRTLQAASTGIHPKLKIPGMDVIFKPGYIDYETRPYHMAWILYASHN